MKRRNCISQTFFPAVAFLIILISIVTSCEKREFERVIFVTTDSVVDLQTNAVSIAGTVIDLGEGGITDYGHCYSTDPSPTVFDEKVTNGKVEELGPYTTFIEGLNPNEIYYVKAYVKNGSEIAYGEEVKIQTKPLTRPVVQMATISISPVSVEANAALSDLGQGINTVSQYGHCWSLTKTEPTVEDARSEKGSATEIIDNYMTTITGLVPDTKYYIRAYATNEVGVAYSETYEITTPKVPEMVAVAGGTFTMGNDNVLLSGPEHEVTLNPYSISKYEITNAEYAVFMNNYGSSVVKDGEYAGERLMYDYVGVYEWGVQKQGDQWVPAQGYEENPAVYITWYGAYEYCKWAGGRLPTEAEWEYAALGGKQSNGYLYSGSNNPDDVAWYDEPWNTGSTHPVGTRAPNELGIYDMSGNAKEWVYDWYSDNYYENSPSENPTGPESGSHKITRGGSWEDSDSYLRVAFRLNYKSPDESDTKTGFRLVIDE